MAETEKLHNVETQPQHNISMSNNFPNDLLQGFISENHSNHKLREEGQGEEDVELSLGLSLNGRFGVDPKAKKLTRSSSIAAEFIGPSTDDGSAFLVPNVESNILARTCSLPTETEEECRKRKAMQSLRRMEARRKRSAKQRNLKAVKDVNRSEEDKRENGSVDNRRQKQLVKNFNGLYGVRIPGLFSQAEAAPPLLPPSHGSGSSGISDSESRPVQGMNRGIEARSPVSVQSLSECEQKLITAPGIALTEKSGSPGPAVAAKENNGCNKPTVAENRTKEVLRNVLEDMPCVSTKGVGPSGKQIEGFLYRYRKGEEVRIVCVCHGSFLSPAEFVKHAGGNDVEQPLKHIVVKPSPFL